PAAARTRPIPANMTALEVFFLASAGTVASTSSRFGGWLASPGSRRRLQKSSHALPLGPRRCHAGDIGTGQPPRTRGGSGDISEWMTPARDGRSLAGLGLLLLASLGSARKTSVTGAGATPPINTLDTFNAPCALPHEPCSCTKPPRTPFTID